MTNPKKSKVSKKQGDRPKKKPGRPRIEFDQKTADSICEQIAEGKSLRRICTQKAMPTKKTVLRWLEENAAFQAQYARARDGQADNYFDELMELQKQATAENAHAIRVRADIIKWACSKLKPKKYGERTAIEIETPEQRETSTEDLARWLYFTDRTHRLNQTLEEFAAEQSQRLRMVALSIGECHGPNGEMPEWNKQEQRYNGGYFAELAQGIEDVAKLVFEKLTGKAPDPLPALPAAPAPPSEPTTRARDSEPPQPPPAPPEREVNPPQDIPQHIGTAEQGWAPGWKRRRMRR